MRNMDPPAICNGRRLIVKKFMSNVIKAIILTDQPAGQDVFIPSISVVPKDIPIHFKPLQFVIRLNFAKSIKVQGQSFKIVVLDVQKPCFSRGQLYIGCSRIENKDNLYHL